MNAYEITNPAPIIQSDIDLVRKMNRTQHSLYSPFDAWPQWAKRDAQLVADYRVATRPAAQPNELDEISRKERDEDAFNNWNRDVDCAPTLWDAYHFGLSRARSESQN